ncbi:MAG: hypothetical protein WC412_04440 [Candidatus Omnitrophota bacterium]
MLKKSLNVIFISFLMFDKNINKVLSSPNRMVWQYFDALRRLCYRVATNKNKEEILQDTVLCVILAVTGVEVFLNIYFHIMINEEPYKHAKEQILSDLMRQVSLDKKLKEWPQKVLGKKIQLNYGIGLEFTNLKKLRNKLVHFSSSYETFTSSSITIIGLPDTTIYDSLDANSALKALDTAEQLICEIFRLQGTEEADICRALHLWTGKVPTYSK